MNQEKKCEEICDSPTCFKKKVAKKLWFSNPTLLKEKKNTEEIVILEWVSGKRCQELEILSQVESAKKFVIL
jgi:hypothetical protein